MTETSDFLLKHHQIRKTKAQKAAFLCWVTPLAQTAGYTVRTQRGAFGSRNIIIGDPTAAKVLFTAHYDTCTVLPLPNFATPKNRLCYLLSQMLLALAVLAVAVPLSILWFLLELPLAMYSLSLILWGMVLFLLFGPANRHTANDNTSGVATILDIMENMPETLKKEAAFVLFDLEEAGLFGSMAFYRKHRDMLKDKPLVNFDCVSDGDHLLFCVKKRATRWLPQLEAAFTPSPGKGVELCTQGFLYPSDQALFPCGIGAAALKRGPLGILYMDRIHTPRDTVFQGENIALLSRGAVRLTALLAKN